MGDSFDCVIASTVLRVLTVLRFVFGRKPATLKTFIRISRLIRL
jgi:hypothetical protein